MKKLIPLLFLIWGTGLVGFISLIPYEPVQDNQTTDAIVVLTGGGLRLDRGFQLLAEHRAQKMFISGVEDGITLASILRKKEYHGYAGQISPQDITLGYKARSTVGNAEETAGWIVEHHIKSIRLVTGNYHMPRSELELHYAIPGIVIIPEPVFPGHFEHNEWWQWGDSIKLVLSEYHKYLASILLHLLNIRT